MFYQQHIFSSYVDFHLRNQINKSVKIEKEKEQMLAYITSADNQSRRKESSFAPQRNENEKIASQGTKIVG